jgi:hypothetical protein
MLRKCVNGGGDADIRTIKPPPPPPPPPAEPLFLDGGEIGGEGGGGGGGKVSEDSGGEKEEKENEKEKEKEKEKDEVEAEKEEENENEKEKEEDCGSGYEPSISGETGKFADDADDTGDTDCATGADEVAVSAVSAVSAVEKPGKTPRYAEYEETIRPLLTAMYHRSQTPYVYRQTKFGRAHSVEEQGYLAFAKRETQLKMKEGFAGEIIYGNAPGYENLPPGHPSGVDIRTTDGSEYWELKNSWNTMNSNSEKTVKDTLAKLYHATPGTAVFWGIINAKDDVGEVTTIHWKGAPIQKVSGTELDKRLFGTEHAAAYIAIAQQIMADVL